MDHGPDPEEPHFEQTTRVSKSHLDPFGARRQAIDHVRSRRGPSAPPNVTGFEYEARDEGDAIEVTVRGMRQRAGPGRVPPGLQRRSDDRPGRGPPDDGDFGVGVEEEVLRVRGPPDRGDFDISSRLDKMYTKPELMREARRHGVHVRPNAGKREIREELVRQAPLAAQRLVGR